MSKQLSKEEMKKAQELLRLMGGEPAVEVDDATKIATVVVMFAIIGAFVALFVLGPTWLKVIIGLWVTFRILTNLGKMKAWLKAQKK